MARVAATPEARKARGVAGPGRAGSRSVPSGWGRPVRRCAGLAPARERLDNDHAPAAARAWRTRVDRFLRRVVVGRQRDGQQVAGEREARLARGPGEQAVVADAVEAARQDVEQEAADELVGGKGHDLLPVGSVTAVILVAEGDAGLVEGEQAPVRNGDPVGVAAT